MKKKLLAVIVSIILASACLLTAACSGKQTTLQNKTALPTLLLTEPPTRQAEQATPTATPAPTPEPTAEPQRTLNPEPGAEPFDLPEYDYEYDKEKYEEVTIFFPENKKGKADFNVEIYDVTPFAVRMILPNGWTYKNYLDIDENELAPIQIKGDCYDGVTRLFSTLWFFDEEGDCVAAIGYRIFEDSDEADIEEDCTPSVNWIYHMIAYGGCRFFVTNQYDIVQNPWDSETAITCSYYGHQYVPDELNGYMTTDSSWQNPAIVSCDYDAEVYIAMEFDHRYIEDELVMEIAKSLQLISMGVE